MDLFFLLFFNAQACSAWPVKQCSFSKKKILSSGHKSMDFPILDGCLRINNRFEALPNVYKIIIE